MLTPPEGEMGSSEKAVAETIKKQAKMIGKVAMTYKFQDLAPLLAEMKTVLEKSNKLPGANPKSTPTSMNTHLKRLALI